MPFCATEFNVSSSHRFDLSMGRSVGMLKHSNTLHLHHCVRVNADVRISTETRQGRAIGACLTPSDYIKMTSIRTGLMSSEWAVETTCPPSSMRPSSNTCALNCNTNLSRRCVNTKPAQIFFRVYILTGRPGRGRATVSRPGRNPNHRTRAHNPQNLAGKRPTPREQ